MIELHSWITIRETYEVCDDEDDDRILSPFVPTIEDFDTELIQD